MLRTGRRDSERDPARVGDAIKTLIADKGWGGQLSLGLLKAEWAKVVGNQIAARSEPIRLENGRLTVRVESGAWAAELALLGTSLATAAARFLGADHVREVAVVAGRIRRR